MEWSGAMAGPSSKFGVTPFFWQVALSILIGVVAGLLILLYAFPAAKEKLITVLPMVRPPSKQPPTSGAFPLLPHLSESMSILVMGVDSNGSDTDRFAGTRSDTMMLVAVNPRENRVSVVSIPRDSRVKIAGNHGVEKINSAHAFGGPELAMQTVREAFSVPVDHYIAVDTHGLKRLFEILGPVEVLVEKEMHYTDHTAKLHVDLKPGLQVLTPQQAEEYVRFRHDARGDIGRIERQQWFIRQAAKKLKEPQIILKMPELVALCYQCVHTDMSMEQLISLASFGKDYPLQSVITAMLPGEAQYINGGSYWIPDMQACGRVFDRALGLQQHPYLVQQPYANGPEQVAYAATTTAFNSVAPESTVSGSNKPIAISIKYSHGNDKLAASLAAMLEKKGYRVRYRCLVPLSECQHEQITQVSERVNEDVLVQLRENIADLKDWPVALSFENHSSVDFILTISPNSTLPTVISEVGGIDGKVPSLGLPSQAKPLDAANLY